MCRIDAPLIPFSLLGLHLLLLDPPLLSSHLPILIQHLLILVPDAKLMKVLHLDRQQLVLLVDPSSHFFSLLIQHLSIFPWTQHGLLPPGAA